MTCFGCWFVWKGNQLRPIYLTCIWGRNNLMNLLGGHLIKCHILWVMSMHTKYKYKEELIFWWNEMKLIIKYRKSKTLMKANEETLSLRELNIDIQRVAFNSKWSPWTRRKIVPSNHLLQLEPAYVVVNFLWVEWGRNCLPPL